MRTWIVAASVFILSCSASIALASNTAVTNVTPSNGSTVNNASSGPTRHNPPGQHQPGGRRHHRDEHPHHNWGAKPNNTYVGPHP